jgi:hypothetical protein
MNKHKRTLVACKEKQDKTRELRKGLRIRV